MTSGSAIPALTASESGPFSQLAPVSNPGGPPVAQVAISNGSGEAVYEVTAQNPLAIETFVVPVYLNASAASLAGASIIATAGLAPVGAAGNIPNFSSASGTITTTASAASTCLPLTISPTTLSTAEQGVPYLQTLGATGVTSWALANGSNPLPAGLSLNAVSGVISGTPTVNGIFSFTIQVTGSTSSASQSFTLQVNPPLSITTTTLAAATQGVPYIQGLGAAGVSALSPGLCSAAACRAACFSTTR